MQFYRITTFAIALIKQFTFLTSSPPCSPLAFPFAQRLRQEKGTHGDSGVMSNN
ncbi:hypothetical protein ACWATR_08175 [Nostoc sp. UIC 10890]